MAKKKKAQQPVDLSDYYLEVGLAIKKLRKKAGLSQVELADEITAMGYHLTAAHLKKIENGQGNYRVQYLYAISKYFSSKTKILPQDPGRLALAALVFRRILNSV